MMYYDQKQCGLRVKQMRKLYGYTQEELAEELNISVKHMGRIETGNSAASIDLLIEMTVVFHVSLDYLVLGRRPNTNIVRHKVKSMIEFLNAVEKEL